MELRDIDKSTAVFWSLGNDPTQKVNNLTFYNVVEHLKLLYLLSDKVLAAGSFYFESEITRNVTKKLQSLFENGEIVYFIDEDIENFEEHGSEKIRKSPKSLAAYKDKELVKNIAKELDSFASPLRRPPSSISDKIVELWIKEINSIETESLGEILKSTIKDDAKRYRIIISLSKFAEERKKDFVWEYLKPYLSKLNLSKQFQNIARRKLSQLYSIATAEVLGISLDINELSIKKYIAENTKYDTSLFYECMKILGVSSEIEKLNTLDLIKLKSSNEFIYFREFYFSLIDSSSYNLSLTKKILPLLIQTEKTITTTKINVNDFLTSFSKLCISLKIPLKNYQNPLDIIMYRYEVFNNATVSPFIDLLKKPYLNKQVHKFTLNPITNGADFYLANQQLIDKIIINNFQIPKTDAPGRFAVVVNIVIKWFNNFKISEYSYALEILRKVKYYSQYDTDELLDHMSGELKKIFNNDFSKVNFFGLGDYGSDSGIQFLYRLRQYIGITETHFPKDYNSLSEEITSIVFIDDIIGSGKQATDFCNQKLLNVNVNKYYYSFIAFESGIQRIKNNSSFREVLSVVKLKEHNKAFSDNSELFPNKKLRDEIEAMSEIYGKQLYPKWPLGFEDSQALIVFWYNTPNNTLPIIWAGLNNEKTIGISWNPLWERKKIVTKKK